MEDVDVAVAHARERTRLVLAVLELPLLVRRECDAERARDGFAVRAARVEREQHQIIGDASAASFPVHRQTMVRASSLHGIVAGRDALRRLQRRRRRALLAAPAPPGIPA